MQERWSTATAVWHLEEPCRRAEVAIYLPIAWRVLVAELATPVFPGIQADHTGAEAGGGLLQYIVQLRG